MVGSELPSPETRESTVTDVPMLRVEGLSLAMTDPDGVVRDVLSDVDFTIHKGEVLGIAGVEGNGQTELIDASSACGRPTAGVITLDDQDITRAPPTRKRREGGIGYIPPEDRHRHGILLDAPPLWENRILGHVTEKPNSRGFLLDPPKAAREDTVRIVREYDVRTPPASRSRPAPCPAATSRS